MAHRDESGCMRFAYADPPYPGQAKRLYGAHPDFAGEVDHAELVAQLEASFPDGWALSSSSSALHVVLPLCPAPEPSVKNRGRYLDGTGTRILIWTKPNGPWRPVGIQYGWEPVLLRGGRPRDPRDHLRDWICCQPKGEIVGAKPYEFAAWLFEAFGARPGDELVDIFPGSGAIGRAWERWSTERLVAV